jgi:drug/metabolite transporter (DMT)-like permease
MQMLAGGTIMVAVGLAFGETAKSARRRSRRIGGGVCVSGRGGDVAVPAYVAVTASSPALVGTYAFVNPVVAVFLGWAVVGETLSGRTGIAVVLVVIGVALLTWPRRS